MSSLFATKSAKKYIILFFRKKLAVHFFIKMIQIK